MCEYIVPWRNVQSSSDVPRLASPPIAESRLPANSLRERSIKTRLVSENSALGMYPSMRFRDKSRDSVCEEDKGELTTLSIHTYGAREKQLTE